MIKINVSTNQTPIKINTSNKASVGIKTEANFIGITKEEDPTVPDWAKEETKPIYTATEVGAVPIGNAMTNSEIEAIFNTSF